MRFKMQSALLVLACVFCGCSGQTEEYEPRPTGALGVAITMKHAGRFAEAESMLRAHMDKAGSEFDYMEELGLVLAAQGRNNHAIGEYLGAIAKFPKHARTAGLYSNLGLAYEFAKLESKALDAYKTAIRMDAKLIQAHVNLGNFYRFVKRDYKLAAEQLEIALKLRPEDFTVRFGLAAIYADTGKLAKAAKGFNLALKLQPLNVVAKTELAYVLMRDKKLEQAELLFDEVIRTNPTFYRAHEGLARLYQAQHKLKKAQQQAKKAIALHSDEGTLTVLADVYQDEGDMPHAHKWWKAVLQANPNDAMAKHYLGLGKPHKKTSEGKSGDDKSDVEAAALLASDLDPPEAVSHSDFMVIVWAALGGGAVLVAVALYSVHLKSQQGVQQAMVRNCNRPEEGMGLMSRSP